METVSLLFCGGKLKKSVVYAFVHYSFFATSRHDIMAMKNENELPQVGFESTTLCTPDRCSYQLSYQGSPAGRVQI